MPYDGPRTNGTTNVRKWRISATSMATRDVRFRAEKKFNSTTNWRAHCSLAVHTKPGEPVPAEASLGADRRHSSDDQKTIFIDQS
jgi:hypothetical protein